MTMELVYLPFVRSKIFLVKAVKVGKYTMTMDGNGWMVKRS